MHEALTGLACITDAEAQRNDGWPAWLTALAQSGRATRLQMAHRRRAMGARRTPDMLARALPRRADASRRSQPPKGFTDAWTEDDALVEIVARPADRLRPAAGRRALRGRLALPASPVANGADALEAEGYVMRGRFTPGALDEEWCERHLLARIHRYTVRRLRREIEPVERHDFMRFLFEWQHLTPRARAAKAATRWPPCSNSWKVSRPPRARGKRTSCLRALKDYSQLRSTNYAAPARSSGPA